MTTRQEIATRLGENAFALIKDDLTPAATTLAYANVEQLLANWDNDEKQRYDCCLVQCQLDSVEPVRRQQSPFWLDLDSDGDGLSDKFEFDQAGKLGTEMDKYDTDGDGLNDGYEIGWNLY